MPLQHPTVCLDFDGVIHWYRKGWNGGGVYDDPIPGVVEAIRSLREDARVVVCTARENLGPVVEWLAKHGIVVDEVTNMKPIANVYVDDRAIRFDRNEWKPIDIEIVLAHALMPRANR